jgi:hypothetical protein
MPEPSIMNRLHGAALASVDRGPRPQAEASAHAGDQQMENLVVARLRLRFPHTAEEDVRGAARDAQAALGPARVRTYLPVLVERSAAETLRVSQHERAG